MAKPIKTKFKLQLNGGQAAPGPIGPVLGQHGLNIQEFIVKFNDSTRDKMGDLVTVEVTVYEDRTFDFIIKTSPAAELIKKALGASKGSGVPNKEKLPKKLSKAQLREIAETKMADLNANDIGQAEKMIAGTARSMGVEIEK